ncbi:MAG: site-2 protease family protein [Candidatus Diapherotrites archaeon]|nr:site-2 protease family protein [Candidatus Diapherotrites archaeon]
MRSLVLGRPFGVAIELHWSFILLVLFILFSALAEGIESMLSTAMLFFFLFMSVILHELTHSIVSINRGISVQRIVLLPIGGVAVAEEIPENPRDEFLISVSGPIFNFSVVIAVILIVTFLPSFFPWHLLSSKTTAADIDRAFLYYPFFTLLYVNLMLGSFNLFLPALPMDGGRVLRSLLSMKMGTVKATRIVTTISAVIAIILFMVSFALQSIILMVIAVFIFFGSREEARFIEAKSSLAKINLKSLINKKPLIIESTQPIGSAIRHMLSKKKFACLVDFGSGKYGVLDLENLPEKINFLEPVSSYAFFPEPISIDMPPNKIFEKFMTKGYALVPIFDSGVLVGVISQSAIEQAYREMRIKERISSLIESKSN